MFRSLRARTPRRSERLFAGHRDPRREVCVVTRDGVTALPHRRLAFDWGVRDGGAVELAHALLRDVGQRPAPDDVVCEFAEDVIAGLPRDGFVLSTDDVRRWLARHTEPRQRQAWISWQYWLFPFV